MKRLLLLALLALGLAVGAAHAAEPTHDHARETKSAAYRCPMHPWITSDKPGKCTICGMDLVAASAASSTGGVALSASQITTIGVATSPVAKQPLTRTLRVAGMIDDDDSRHRLLTARAEGRVEKLFVTSVGVTVRAGEPLYTLYSPELQAAQRDLVQLARAGELAAPALPAARARLTQMGLTAAQLDELLKRGEPELVTTIVAPVDGTVIEKTLYEGQWLKTGDKLLGLADFSKMWFVFDAYEQDIPWLALGQNVEITTRAVPGEVIAAPIAFIDPNFNEMTRTTKVRVVLSNPHFGTAGEHHALPHRVLAEGRVHVTTPAVLTVPRAAVLDGGSGPIAYVDRGDNSYEPRALKLGRRGDTAVEILSGLSENENVVTQGALLLDAQAQLTSESGAGLRPASSPPPTPTSPTGRELTRAQSPAFDSQPSSLNFSALATAAIDSAAALAADDYAAYQKKFPALAAAAQPFSALPSIAPGTDLKTARRSFEPWSTAVADLLKPQRAELGLKIFQCPMSPVLRHGRWVQRAAPLKNPFFGSAMLDCGSEVP